MASKGRSRVMNDENTTTVTSSPSVWLTVTTILTIITVLGLGVFVGSRYFQDPSNFERLDHGLEKVLNEIIAIKEQLATLKNAGCDNVGSSGDDYIEYTSKYRPLPPDFEMFAIGFIIICFIVTFMVYKGDINRGN